MEIRAVVCCMVVVFVCASVRTEACSDTDCVSSDGQVCSGHGVCDCGTCVCEGNYTGPNCEQCPGCQSPCALFRDCVQCKTFGTGSLGIVDCINRCEYLANYNPLEAAPAGGIGGMTVCEIDDEEGCVFTFKIGASSEGYRNLYIDTELDCPVYEPTDSTPEEYDPEYVTEDVIEGQVSSTTGTTDIGDTTVGAKGNVKTTEQNKNTAKPEHPKQQTPGVVSGSENTHVSDNLSHQDNAAIIMSVSMATVTVCLLFVLGL